MDLSSRLRESFTPLSPSELLLQAGSALPVLLLLGILFLPRQGQVGAQSPPPGPFQLQVLSGGQFLVPGDSRQFAAVRVFFRNSGQAAYQQDVTSRVAWSSSDSTIAGVTNGLVSAVNAGVVTITATDGRLTASAQLTVSSTVMLNSISIAPASQVVIQTAGPLTYTATGSFSDNSTQDISSTAAWSSSSTAVATMSANVATLTGAGSTIITASQAGVNASVSLSVAPQLAISPQNALINVLQTQSFSANLPVTWSVDGVAGGNSTSGAITAAGLYKPTAASVGGSHMVSAASMNPPQTQSVMVQVVSGFAGVLTFHNDAARSGLNPNEVVLNPSNVNSAKFGKLFTLAADGKVDAQPLYVPNLTLPGKGTHNVLFVASEHDAVYAFDADSGALLWQVSMLGAGETPSDNRGCGQVSPEIGVTSTPAIDLNAGPHGTMYVVAMSKSGSTYFQRIHALDLTTGGEQFGGPVLVQATYPGNGANNDGHGHVVFDPKQYKERSGLLLLNGKLYTSWASHCDAGAYTGWVIVYDQNTLAQTNVLNVTPNGSEGAFWNAGGGLAADSGGSIYQLVANGSFDTTLNPAGFPNQGDFGNAFVRISTGGVLSVADYFAMSNVTSENNADEDLGSGGAMVLPDMVDAQNQVRHLAVGAGKDGNVYLVDRDNMGKFNPNNNNQIYQEIAGGVSGGVFSSPAYFNGRIYYGAVGDLLRAFQFTQARLGNAPDSVSAHSYGFPGASPSISSTGNSNAVLWVSENSNPAVLHAYDANDLNRELYNSNQAAGGRDHFGAGNKFIAVTIANGKVYVGTTNGVGVFGLLP